MNSIRSLLVETIDVWTSAEDNKKSGRGRSSGASNSLFGVSRLRDLILELAIQGRLVNQDRSEESATQLLNKIQPDASKIASQGDRAQAKKPTKLIDDEIALKLPNGWAPACLGNVVDIIRGITFPGSEKSKVPGAGRIACLRTSNIQDQIDWKDLLFIGENFISRDNQILRPKDIVMSMANSRELVGKVALVNCLPEKTTFGGFLGVIRSKLISPDFLMIFLRAPSTRASLVESSSQTTNIANISLAKLNPLILHVPPLAEQHRIVEKVRELMIFCDELEISGNAAKASRKNLVERFLESLLGSTDHLELELNWSRISEVFSILFIDEEDITLLKKCILRLAITGRLVRPNKNEELVDNFLASLKENKSDARVKKKKEINSMPIKSGEGPFHIPKSWRWVRANEICRPISSGSTPAAEYLKSAGDIPFLKVYNIRDQKIDFEYQKQFVDHEIHNGKLKRSRLYPGDVVMNIVGPPLGKVAIIPPTHDEWNCNQAISFFGLLRPLKSEYFYLFLCEGSFINGIELIGTAGQDNISVTKAQNIPVPIPPLEEQERIVSKVNELFSICDQLKSYIVDASKLQRKIANVLVEEALI
jgi:type I restriction enzyme, S subunit